MIAEIIVGAFREYSNLSKKYVRIHLVIAANDKETNNLTLSIKKSPVFLIYSKTSIVVSDYTESSRYFLILDLVS